MEKDLYAPIFFISWLSLVTLYFKKCVKSIAKYCRSSFTKILSRSAVRSCQNGISHRNAVLDFMFPHKILNLSHVKNFWCKLFIALGMSIS